ncbi:MAG: uroporphyrinogen decarboxylase [Phycisphaerae bacterium]|nr:uroporphyrinogen decarboxylase [Phycisphaerae bacterium]
MTGKERIKKAFNCETTDRVPWVPFVGCHAGALLGYTAEEFFKSEEKMIRGVQKAIQMYQPDGIPVAFDLQIEAEVLGCDIAWADDNPPAVISHPLANGTKLEDLKVPTADQGRIKIVTEVARKLCQANPDIALYGLITGPFTLGLHLLGTDIFLKMFDENAYVKKLMTFCKDVCIAMSKFYLDAGCDIIAVVDPMTSQIGPAQFKEFVTPYMIEIFEYVRQQGGLSSFFVCGHAQQNIAVMCETRCDNISIDENIPLDYVRDECLKHNMSFGGNLQLTTVLLLGKEIDAQKNAIACIEIAGEKGFILAPGCDVPYATPPANLQAVAEIVCDEYKRQVAKTIAVEESSQMKLDLAEYGQADKVIVDIITLDSEACAPCQYMVDAVRKIAPEFDGIVQWREHKIKYRESLVFMASLMVRNIPTICIDGQITFVSRIPPKHELIAAIQDRINDKFRMRIQQRKAVINILSGDDEHTKMVQGNVAKAVQELGADVDIENISDPEIIASFGIFPAQCPAIVMTQYQMKSIKRVPEVVVIKEWIKNL